jgi:hypothetical protein
VIRRIAVARLSPYSIMKCLPTTATDRLRPA